MSEVVTNGISYRGTSCVTTASGQLRICLRLTRGLHSGLDVRGRDTVVPGLAGRVPRNRVKDRRLLEIEGEVMGVGSTEAARLADFESAMATLAGLFDPSLAAGALVVMLQGGGTATISARTLPETIEGDDGLPGYRRVSYRLEATSPDWS
jgi:hypothetical protein